MARPLLIAAVLLAASPLSGCAAVAVVDTAASVAATTVKTGAKVTGAVVGAGVDAMTTSEREACIKEMKRQKQDTRVCYEKR